MYYLTEAGRSFLQLRELMDVGPAIQQRQAALDTANAPPKTRIGRVLKAGWTGAGKVIRGAATVVGGVATDPNLRRQINTPL